MFCRHLKVMFKDSPKAIQAKKFSLQDCSSRCYAKTADKGQCKCGCQSGGECTCGPDCPCKKPIVCRSGPTKRALREPPNGYAPECVLSKAFKPPSFIRPQVYRPLKANDVLGPNASKLAAYKNPEYFSYHSFSFYDLKLDTQNVKDCAKSRQKSK